MPATYTHIFYAYLVAPTLQVRDEARFIVGTLFPDIRALKPSLMKKTHPSDVTLTLIKSIQNDFYKGWWFHVWLDRFQREFLLKKTDLFLNGFVRTTASAYKLLEDQYTHTLLPPSKISKTYRYLNLIFPEELSVVPQIQILRSWHKILQEYISTDFIPKKAFMFWRNTNVSSDTIRTLSSEYERLTATSPSFIFNNTIRFVRALAKELQNH